MLKRLAAKQLPEDEAGDFNPMEYSGGNFDDAYRMGLDSGEVQLARQIMKVEGIEP
jgi:hypothetical protein